MSFEGLQERLAALQETTSQLRELIGQLANLEFEPGSVPLGTDDESSPSGELSAEISQLLRGGLEEQELLQEEAKYVSSDGHETAKLRDGVERLGAELVSCRFSFRKARLTAKKNQERAQKLERELVIQAYSATVSEAGPDSPTDAQEPEKPRIVRQHRQQQQQYSSLSEQDQQTVGASSNVTNSLRRTHDLIAAELSRSEFAHETLTESSVALKQLNESYSSLDSMLASSRDLLGTLLRSQKSDTWYLQTAMYMLLATAAWLFFRRILYGPMWWLVWLPLRVLFGIGKRAGGAIMPGRSGPEEPGQGASGGVDAKVSVDGLPREDLPTAQVGQEGTKSASDENPDSMVAKVGKIVDGEQDTENTVGENDRPKDEL